MGSEMCIRDSSGLESGVAKDCGAALVDLDCSCPLGSCLSDIVDFPDKTD